MTGIAAIARANAISIEGKKDGLYQKKGADWVVRFTIQSSDLVDALKDAPLGTRYAMALVEIDDDEQPKQRDAAGNDASAGEAGFAPFAPRPVSPSISDKPRKSWHDLSPAQQAGLLCNEPRFHAYLRNVHSDRWTLLNEGTASERAALIVRSLCNVKSRSEITSDSTLWRQLVADYRYWEREAEIVG